MAEIYYKYRPINNYLDSLLLLQEVYFSFGYEYNDPFDSKVRIEMNATINDILGHLENTELDDNTKEKLKQRIVNNEFSKDQYLLAAYEVAKTCVMSTCFTIDQLNVLMWSHYADAHKGICLGFQNVSTNQYPALKFDFGYIPGDPPILENGVLPIREIKYDSNEIISWEPFLNDIDIFIAAHMNKARYWSYEREHRIILAYKQYNTKKLKFDKRYLKEVYLGARIKNEDKGHVIKCIEDEYIKNGYNVKVYQVKASKSSFNLEYDEI